MQMAPVHITCWGKQRARKGVVPGRQLGPLPGA